MRIAVIIPIRGRVQLLRSCLASIQAQQLRPSRVIVVDDANTASDAASIKDIAASAGAEYLRTEIQGGASAARNYGAAQATGIDTYFFCDADITLAPNALHELASALEKNPQAAYAYSDFMFGKRLMRAEPFSLAALRHQNFISTMSLVRAAAFLGFDPTLKRFQDWDLWLTLATQGKYGVYVPQVLFTADASGSISTWIPSILARNAHVFSWIPRVKKYAAARAIILKKQGL